MLASDKCAHKCSAGFKGIPKFKYNLLMASISRCPPKVILSNILAYSPFALVSYYVQLLCPTDFCAENIIGSDNHTTGSSAQINKSLQLCFSSEFLVFYHFGTKSVQNKQHLKFSATLLTKSGSSTLTQM